MPTTVWRKLASAKWADAWEERLRFLGPTRLVLTRLPGGRSIRIDAYGVTAAEGRALVKGFGGTVVTLANDAWMPSPADALRPVKIRGRLLIAPDPAALPAPRAGRAPTPVLCIPAGMAFGTGEHATTASCLRFLADVSRGLREREWSLLDVGTGSGILALASIRLGAKTAEGFDFDPHAVRTARANARLNRIRSARFHRADVREWEPEGAHAIVAANLFSELLIAVLPRLVRAIEPGGHAILSGILRTQEAGVVRALKAVGLRLLQVTHRGKWVALLARRPAQRGPGTGGAAT